MARLSTLTTDLVGRRYPRYNFLVSAAWVADYRRAIGYEKNEGPEVPATFISCLRDSEFCAFAALDLKLRQLLHAGQDYKFHAPVQVGDWITSQTVISRCAKKRGKSGEMVFMDFKNEFRKTTPAAVEGQDWVLGELVAESTMTVVVKESE